MRTISINVGDNFVCPPLYESTPLAGDEERSLTLREVALLLGARVVSEVLAVRVRQEVVSKVSSEERTTQLVDCLQTERDLQAERLANTKNLLERTELARQEADRQAQQAMSSRSELLEQIGALREQHNNELDKIRRELTTKLQTEKLRVREEITAKVDSEVAEKVRREAMEVCREAILAEKEKHAREREAVVMRLEERHALSLALEDQRSSGVITELRTSLQSLRAEHEGLVIKLMSRLEPVSSVRGGTGATTSAAALGRTFEESVQKHLRETFGARNGFHLEDVHTTGHSGDLIMIFDGLRILIELKSYDPKTRVPTKEIEKLARDLAEVQPRCDAAIMISACSEITGHYSCGPLEVSSSVACVPVLFVNNFLSLGEPLVTLHMTRVFLSMVRMVASSLTRAEEAELASTPENREGVEAERVGRLHRATSECVRRCNGYLADLARQSTDILHQVGVMKNGAIKLRESVISLIESETARFNGIVHLMSSSPSPAVVCGGSCTSGVEATSSTLPVGLPSSLPLPQLDRSVFVDPTSMSPILRELAVSISTAYDVGDHKQQCPTKELLSFIQKSLQVKTEKTAREALKSILLETIVRHGHVMGISKKVESSQQQITTV